MNNMKNKEKAMLNMDRVQSAFRANQERDKGMLNYEVKEITKQLENEGFDLHLDFNAQKQFDGQDQTMTFRNEALELDVEVSIMGRFTKDKYNKLNLYAVRDYMTHAFDSSVIFDTTQYDYLATYLKGFGHSVHISAQDKF
jgi:hypothetical protein